MTDIQLRMSGIVLAYLIAPFLTGILYLPWIFRKTDLAPDQILRLSALLALFTAPCFEIFSALRKR